MPTALKLIFSYLTNRTKIIKIHNSISTQSSIEYSVLQGSVLGPLLFNIGLSHLFYECEDLNIANYTDDTTTYACGEVIRPAILELKSLALDCSNVLKTTT